MIKTKCEKCQRVIEVSEQEAEHLDGMLVCPQCLNTVKVPVSRKPKAKSATPPPLTTVCPHCNATIKKTDRFCNKCGKAVDAAVTPPKTPASPPAYRKPVTAKPTTTKSAPTPSSQPVKQKQVKSTAMAQPRRTKQSTAKNHATPRQPLSTWGCLGLSILITLLAFTIYALAGAFL